MPGISVRYTRRKRNKDSAVLVNNAAALCLPLKGETILVSIATEFKDFVLRGNVVDLAVGVVIGGAFGTVVTALVKDIVTPLIGIPGKISLGDISYKVNGSTFLVGEFLNAVISFVILAFVIFFFVVKPINWLMSHAKSKTPEPESTRDCPECLSKIPIAASRCAFCTANVPAAAA
jgi:large conductance mechanosensitive channel